MIFMILIGIYLFNNPMFIIIALKKIISASHFFLMLAKTPMVYESVKFSIKFIEVKIKV